MQRKMTKYDERLSVNIKAVTRIAGKTKNALPCLIFPHVHKNREEGQSGVG